MSPAFLPHAATARWPRVCARAASPEAPRRVPIAEQAAARGELFRAEDAEDRGAEPPLDTTSTGRLTGFVWACEPDDYYYRAIVLGQVFHAPALRSVSDGELLSFLRAAGLGSRQVEAEAERCPAVAGGRTKPEREERYAQVLGRLERELDQREAGYAAAEGT